MEDRAMRTVRVVPDVTSAAEEPMKLETVIARVALPLPIGG